MIRPCRQLLVMAALVAATFLLFARTLYGKKSCVGPLDMTGDSSHCGQDNLRARSRRLFANDWHDTLMCFVLFSECQKPIGAT